MPFNSCADSSRAPVIQDITIKPDAPVLDLGIAKLAPIATMLEAVTIKEEKATVITEPADVSLLAQLANDLQTRPETREAT